MSKHIIVTYKGNGLLVHPEVANLLGLKHGHRIQTEAEFWNVLRANSEHMIDRINLIEPTTKKNKSQ